MKDRPTLVTSFVHAYNNLEINLPDTKRPCLWVLQGKKSQVFNFQFLRNPDDFHTHPNLWIGTQPLSSAKNFKKLPRFGLTGLAEYNRKIYAGSWNGVYQIDSATYEPDTIISNHLMHNPHGIHVDNTGIYTVINGKDTVVQSDFDGAIIDHFSIAPDLTVKKIPGLETIDWRFISKQYLGSTGIWHFNYIQIIEDELWLTSRNANCFVVINKDRSKARLELIGYSTPVLIHDGFKYGNIHYLTSIDGKVILAGKAEEVNWPGGEMDKAEEIEKFERALVTKLIRIDETNLGRQPNWCRGLTKNGDSIFVTIDGRYDTDLSFGVLELKEDQVHSESRLRWSDIGDEKELRYVTGFDILSF